MTIQGILHGGSLIEGSAAEHGVRGIIRNFMVMMVVHYRLDFYNIANEQPRPMGYVKNRGLHDQRTAFRWIEENIRLYGSNPERALFRSCLRGVAYADYAWRGK